MRTMTKALVGVVAGPVAAIAPTAGAVAATSKPPQKTATVAAPRSLKTLTLADLPKLKDVQIRSTLVSTTEVKRPSGITDRTATFAQDVQLPGYTAATYHMSIHWQFDGKTIIGDPSVGDWEDVNFPVCVTSKDTIAEYKYNSDQDFLSDRRLNIGISYPWGCASGGSATIQAHVNGAGSAWTV
jgi:hypothetical protein